MTRQLQQGSQTLIRDNVVHVSPDVGNFDHDGQAGDDHRDTLFTFDAQGRQLTRTLPLDVSSFNPNAIGVGVLDASGHIPTTFTPDPFTEYFWHHDLGQRVYAYDAYGLPIGFDPAGAFTSLLYSGEILDQRIAMQYLRARYYNPASGTFNRLDPFAGNMRDPQSLHKYLYVHGDPVQGIDPSGEAWSVRIALCSIGIAAIVGHMAYTLIYRPMRDAYVAAEAARQASLGTRMQTQQLRQIANTINTYWPSHAKMQTLADRLGGPDPTITIRVMPTNDYAEGLSAEFTKVLVISQSAINDGDIATALVTFAEFQHIPDGGNLNEEDAQAEFIAVRNMLPANKKTQSIIGLHHKGTTNP